MIYDDQDPPPIRFSPRHDVLSFAAAVHCFVFPFPKHFSWLSPSLPFRCTQLGALTAAVFWRSTGAHHGEIPCNAQDVPDCSLHPCSALSPHVNCRLGIPHFTFSVSADLHRSGVLKDPPPSFHPPPLVLTSCHRDKDPEACLRGTAAGTGVCLCVSPCACPLYVSEPPPAATCFHCALAYLVRAASQNVTCVQRTACRPSLQRATAELALVEKTSSPNTCRGHRHVPDGRRKKHADAT